ncbi:MAG: hypothetical protein AB1295_06495 [Candidatus Micrarchaeota archaeon]
MRGRLHGHLPVVLVLASLLFFGCLGAQQGGESGPVDSFGPKVEEMNSKVYSASSASAVSTLQTEVAALRAEAQADDQYSKYLQLIDAQDLTLEVLAVYYGFQAEGSVLGVSGVDCSKDYSSFLAKLDGVQTTADAAKSKANAYLSVNPDSSADKLISVIDGASPASMVAYAEILENEYSRDCPALIEPSETYALPLSYEDALAIAASEAGDTYYVYGFQETLPAGTVITAPRAMGDRNFTLSSDVWFFFLDSDPWGPFGHETRFVMIEADTAEYLVSEEDMYPIIGGVEHWKSIDDRTNADNVLYPYDVGDIFDITIDFSGSSDTHYLYSYPLAADVNAANAGKDVAGVNCCPEKNKYALILTGSNDSMFQIDTAAMYGHLTSSGFSAGNVYYLTSSAGVDGSDGVTSVAKLAEGLNWLASKAKCCDEVFIYLGGHGSKDPVRQFKHKTSGETRWIRRVADLGASPGDWEATGSTGDYHRIDVSSSAGRGFASSEALVGFIEKINSCDVTIMYQSCHSGAAAPTLAATPGVRVLTPVDSEHSSYGRNGGDDPGSFFTNAYIAAKTTAKATADKNGDGTVSEREAFDHADKTNHDTIEDIRRRLNEAADAAADPAEKARLRARAAGMQEQTGVYKEGGPCWCCYVDCNESTDWRCTVFEAFNKPNCEECRGKKVGDYCKEEAVTDGGGVSPPEDGGGTTTGGDGGTGEGEGGTAAGGETGTGGTEQPAVCGDGNITGAETCDYGSTSTNKCPDGEYCHDSCICKKLETSVVCGDGKISSPSEECDGGNVKFKLCQPGYTCSICKCVPTEAACGDGRIDPPEECDHGNSYTKDCPGGKTCYGCKCLLPDEVPTDEIPPTEAYCGNDEREGAEECDGSDASACGFDEHCSGCVCVADEPDEAVCGDGDVEGNEDCESDNDCSGDETCENCRCVAPEPPDEYCGDGAVNGNEECDGETGCSGNAVCSSGCTCVEPPTLNCNEICGYTPGAQVIATGLSSESACQAATSEYFTSQTCYTTCKYSWFYKVTNIAGYASCCCGMKKQFACSDCPGQNPECPDANSVCPANAPSWYSP